MTPTPTPDAASLVERLRARRGFWLNGGTWVRSQELDDPLCAEAADRIAALEAERDRLRTDCTNRHAELMQYVQRAEELGSQIDALEARVRELREALGWFICDERFQVAVGGNPNVVDAMLSRARALVQNEK